MSIFFGDKKINNLSGIKNVYKGNSLIYPVKKKVILYDGSSYQGIWSTPWSRYVDFTNNGISFSHNSEGMYVTAHQNINAYKILCASFTEIGSTEAFADRYIYIKVGLSNALSPVRGQVTKSYPRKTSLEAATLTLSLENLSLDGENNWIRVGVDYGSEIINLRQSLSFNITKIWLEG